VRAGCLRNQPLPATWAELVNVHEAKTHLSRLLQQLALYGPTVRLV
jgi:hypothetical protein